MDYRRADPNYIGFVPETAADAIDLFFRMKRLGLRPEHFPEAFVWCSRKLNDQEGVKFEEWLVAPQGVSKTRELYKPDPEAEQIRLQLLKEAEARDLADALARNTIAEESTSPLEPDQEPMEVLEPLQFDDMEVDDEKVPTTMSAPSER